MSASKCKEGKAHLLVKDEFRTPAFWWHNLYDAVLFAIAALWAADPLYVAEWIGKLLGGRVEGGCLLEVKEAWTEALGWVAWRAYVRGNGPAAVGFIARYV